jgi:uroporphyrin-III C-methyltransferase
MIGKAYLVGAGPGRADLITWRGLKVLRLAEVVLYDRLIPHELLDETRPGTELIYVGKEPGCRTWRQEDINRLLVERVCDGKMVVRLKGGDPFVFGRGGEEALALAEAGLPFEIIPGVSSALAVPAYAGVPVTHRGVATSFAVVTGHEDGTKQEDDTNWEVLARIPTLVILMGLARIGAICDALLAAGRSPDTPSLAVSWGTTEHQRTVCVRLAELPSALVDARVVAPAVIVVGEVAALHERLAWFKEQMKDSAEIVLS